ncbi:ABC transporter substrate-binding protein [Glaciecola sp. XM2]|nr:ABC transporter substrate-binding protein [Glaciecola sp. XM2]
MKLIEIMFMNMLLKIVIAAGLLFVSHSQASANQDMRIVSAGGSVTEILFALGMGSNIVASDTSSAYPEAASALPKIGYYRQLSTEGVLKMLPTHIFAIKGAGPEAVLQQLEALGVNVFYFEQERSEQGLYTLISNIGQRVGRTTEADALNAQIRNQISALPKVEHNVSPIFLMSANERGLMAAGSNTVPDLLLDVLSLENPFASLDGFKPISSESLLASGANLIFLPEHQTRGLGTDAICKTPALSSWASLHGCNIQVVDSLLFLGLTPRLPSAAKQMAQAINAAP